MTEPARVRGRAWLGALTGKMSPMPGDPNSVLTADAQLGDEIARFLCVVPDPHARFPCARDGQVGLEEAYTLAARVREFVDGDQHTLKRPIVAIVDVKSQAYGRREETAAIFLRPMPTVRRVWLGTRSSRWWLATLFREASSPTVIRPIAFWPLTMTAS
jgi:malonate decarboxylase gamma subunit